MISENALSTLSIIIGVGGIIIGVGVAYYFYRLQIKHKSIWCGVLFSLPVLKANYQQDELASFPGFNGMAIGELYLIAFVIENDGDLPIASSDFEVPLKLTMEHTKILAASVVAEASEHLGARADVVEGAVIFKSILLDAEDWYVVHMLASGRPHSFDISGRVLGISDITLDLPRNVEEERMFYVIGGCMNAFLALMALFTAVYVFSSALRASASESISFIISFVLTAVLFFVYGYFRLIRIKKKIQFKMSRLSRFTSSGITAWDSLLVYIEGEKLFMSGEQQSK